MIQIFVIVFVLIPTMAFAWNDGVQMVIALIAKKHLQPGVLNKIENLAADINGEFPEAFDFVEAAYWMNRVSRRGCGLFDSWHDEMLLPLNKSVVTLGDSESGMWEKNFCLRVLICCIGDLHHPFCRRESSKSLRELWNSLFDIFPLEYSGSFEEDEQIKKIVDEINEKFSCNSFFEKKERTFEDWAHESALLAEMMEGDQLTSDYIQRYELTARRQIAIAGCHLADVLNKIFGKK